MSERETSPFKGFIAGGFGGICAVLSSHPLDTLKTRIQTMPVPESGKTPMYTGTFDCARKILSREGPGGFYKGMAAPLVLVAPVFAVSFSGYHLGRSIQQDRPNAPLSFGQVFVAGAIGGAFQTTLITPGDRIKCLLQIQLSSATAKYSGPIDCSRQLFREGGIRSIYRGLCVTLLRDIPGCGVYYFAYEWLRFQMTPKGGSPNDIRPLQILFAGGMAGVANWVYALPIDVLKSRLQAAPEGIYGNGARSVFAEMMRKEGFTALGKGAVPVMLRAFPANAAAFFGYEVCMNALNKAETMMYGS